MKWRTIIVGAVTFAVLFSMVGCGGKSALSRGKAQKVIQASDKFTPGAGYPEVSLNAGAVQSGLQAGFWEKAGQRRFIYDPIFVLTPKGKTYFSLIVSLNADESGPTRVTLKPMPRRVTEVTGVTDGPGILGPPGTIKDVQFTWKWDLDPLPQEVKPFLGTEPPPSKGEALLKLYDDGWRVEQVNLP
jgi:hypothetical protein